MAAKVTGQTTHFSWGSLVASAIGSGVTSALGLPTQTQQSEGLGTGHFLDDLSGGLINGAIDSGTARLLGGQGADGEQITEDAFGNALGNAAIAGINSPSAAQQGDAFDFAKAGQGVGATSPRF